MTIELTVINLIPPIPNGRSAAAYVPITVHQKKLFTLENMMIEQCTGNKGKVLHKYSVAKYDGEYYKLKIPYEELKFKYLNDNVIKGFGK